MEEIEKALEPRRLLKIGFSIFLILGLFFGIYIGVLRMDQAARQEESKVKDRNWFAAKQGEISALREQITSAQQALARIKERLDEQWLEASSDRTEYQKLNAHLLELQEKKATAVQEYNSAAIAVTDITTLVGLPPQITSTPLESEE